MRPVLAAPAQPPAVAPAQAPDTNAYTTAASAAVTTTSTAAASQPCVQCKARGRKALRVLKKVSQRLAKGASKLLSCGSLAL